MNFNIKKEQEERSLPLRLFFLSLSLSLSLSLMHFVLPLHSNVVLKGLLLGTLFACSLPFI